MSPKFQEGALFLLTQKQYAQITIAYYLDFSSLSCFTSNNVINESTKYLINVGNWYKWNRVSDPAGRRETQQLGRSGSSTSGPEQPSVFPSSLSEQGALGCGAGWQMYGWGQLDPRWIQGIHSLQATSLLACCAASPAFNLAQPATIAVIGVKR